MRCGSCVQAINPERTIHTVQHKRTGKIVVCVCGRLPSVCGIRNARLGVSRPCPSRKKCSCRTAKATSASPTPPNVRCARVPFLRVRMHVCAQPRVSWCAAEDKPDPKAVGRYLQKGGACYGCAPSSARVPIAALRVRVLAVCADFADVKDNKTWRVAEVLDVKEHDLHFRFLGWAEVRARANGRDRQPMSLISVLRGYRSPSGTS